AVRSLRQSTLAKRSNASPPVSTKKSSVKSGSAPKTGQKQERSPTKEGDAAAPSKTEQSREVRRSTRLSGQAEGTAAAASQSNTKRLPGPEEGDEIKSETLGQTKLEETSQELSCGDLAGACSSPGGTTETAVVATKAECGDAGSVCSVSTDTEITAVKNDDNVIDSMDSSETSSGEKTENKLEKSEEKTEEPDQSGVTGKASDPSSVCVIPSEICQALSSLASSVEEEVDCSLGSHSVEIPGENTSLVKDRVTEPGDDDMEVEKTLTSSEKVLDSTGLDDKDLKSEEFTSADPQTSILESFVLDQPSQNVQEQLSSAKVEGLEGPKSQDDEKQMSVSSKCEKNVRPRHSKSIIQNKQNTTPGSRQKSGVVQQEVTRSRTRAGLGVSGLHSQASTSLKRNADEQESPQRPNNPVKIRKKQPDLGLKAKSCVSGGPVKKQSNTLLKKIPRVVASGQVQKSAIQRASEVSPKEISGHASNLAQKQGQGQKLPTLLKSSSAKDEAEAKDHPGVEHLKEDEKEKTKSKRVDRNLQPRQRRSSKSLSLDEPPLFIPDNIATVKREGAEHPSAPESRSVWVPNKQCGFCKKPHGNRC
ncbi:PREDICTED: PHD finger protein 3-like, partial [Mesitornis unicolor]|uniref:PHD finger protein 3-like n=1 Tax=Mesitornis unicolor TaxID=54374 RepID=UPI0005289469